MLTGRKFKLTRDTLAITANSRIRRAISVPAGEIVEVLYDCEGGHTIDAAWQGQTVEMFKADVNVLGAEIVDRIA